MSWLPLKLPPQCKIVLTTVRSDLTYKTLSQRPDTKVLLVPLFTDNNQKSSMVTENLAIHCKCLDQAQLQRVVTSKLSDRPLFLSILANELRVRGTYGNLDKVGLVFGFFGVYLFCIHLLHTCRSILSCSYDVLIRKKNSFPLLDTC